MLSMAIVLWKGISRNMINHDENLVDDLTSTTHSWQSLYSLKDEKFYHHISSSIQPASAE